MEIITEDGKDYLHTYIVKIDNHTIDANMMFLDLQETVDKIIKAKNSKHKTRDIAIYKGYGSNLQSLLNRYSGDYFSPSFLKNYLENPAMSLMGNFFTAQANDPTAIGDVFHLIMETYYKLPPEERDRKKLWDIEESLILPEQDKSIMDKYIQGMVDIKDYLHPRTPLDDTKLECRTEHKGRINNLYVKSLGYTIPCAVSYVADRIDYRGDDVIILDYKTGEYKEYAKTFEGYLGSMILYKWAMEQELNTTITKGYLIYPGSTKKYIEMDYSKENEEKMVETIDTFYKQFMRDVRSRELTFDENKGYFVTEDAKAFKEIMTTNTIWNAKMPIDIYIGEHNESYL